MENLLGRISLIVPSRGRPRSLMRMLTSAIELADRADLIDAVVLFDDDDEQSLALTFDDLPVVRLVRSQMTMGARTLTCIEHATGEILILANDDAIVRTPSWDSRIRREATSFEDDVYFLYPNDMFKGVALPTFPIISKRIAQSYLYKGLDAYRGAFLDVHLLEIFQRLRKSGHDRIRFLEDVLFEHLHHRTGKSSWDDTYARRVRFGDDATFAALAPVRKETADRLRQRVEGIAEPETGADKIVPKPTGSLTYPLNLLFDLGLPTGWRLRLALWYLARQVYRTLLGRESRSATRGKG